MSLLPLYTWIIWWWWQYHKYSPRYGRCFEKVEIDFYGSLCPEIYKHSCKYPPSLNNKYAFLHNFIKNSNGFPVNAMLGFWVDLRVEHDILCQARSHARLNCPTKRNHIFQPWDQTHLDCLMSFLKMWSAKIAEEKKKGKYVWPFSNIPTDQYNHYNTH